MRLLLAFAALAFAQTAGAQIRPPNSSGVAMELQQDTSLSVRAVSHHVHYYVKDPLSLRAWYVNTFSAESRKRGVFDSADIAGTNLSFAPIRDDPPRAATKGRALDHVGFEVKGLEAFCKRLQANGVTLDAPCRSIPALGITTAFLTDPSGVSIELTEGLDTF